MKTKRTTQKQVKEYAAFKKTVGEFLLSIGATYNEIKWYPYELQTPVGILSICPENNWLACRFADVEKAKTIKDSSFKASLNPYSGKWNFMVTCGNKLDGAMALTYFKLDLKRCLGIS